MLSRNRAALWRAAALVVIIAALIVVGFTVPLPSVEEIRSAAQGAGWLGAVVFVLGYGLVTLTPVPKNVVSIAAGLTWGLWLGVLLVYLGALIGAALAFALGRALGREAVERFTGARVARVDELLRERGVLSVIGARLVPILPFTVVNYSAGLTSLRPRDYALGTAIGMLPGTFAYVAVGAYGTTLGWGFTLAIGALGLLTIGGVVAGYRWRKSRGRAGGPDASGPVPETCERGGSGHASEHGGSDRASESHDGGAES